MTIHWNRIRDIIRVDLVMMKGGKSSMKLCAILSVLLFGAMGFCVSPLAGLYLPFLLSAFFVPMLFHNEMKYHSEKLWSLLPIERSDLVNARYLLSFALYTAGCLAVYLLMLLAMALRLWRYMDMEYDVVGMMAEKTGNTPLGLFNVCYFGVFACGLALMASSLRKYFRDSQAFSAMYIVGAQMKKSNQKEILSAAVILSILAVWVLIAAGILPVGDFLLTLLALLMQLVQAADGFLLGAVCITVGVFQIAYAYVCTILEYDVKEL